MKKWIKRIIVLLLLLLLIAAAIYLLKTAGLFLDGTLYYSEGFFYKKY